MQLPDPQLTASRVLHIFHHDEPYLFLGAAFTTVGLVAAAISLLRRRLDSLSLWFALFAILYGGRLWLDSDLLGMAVPNPHFFHTLKSCVKYLVAIPAFFYFHASGFLGRTSKAFLFAFCALLLSLMAATLLLGPLFLFDVANNVIIIAALTTVVVRSIRSSTQSRDFVVIRRGLFVFVALAFWDNIAGTFHRYPRIEPYGFAIFLACLGYVTARRTMQRDQQLTLLEKELEIATRIQLSILPPAFPPSAHFQVVARYLPMTAVAGDFYDFLLAEDHHAGLLIADVSGHGVPAALIASMVKLAATTQRGNAAHPSELLAGMNAALCGNTQNQFVTAAYVYLNAHTREFRYAAAGHPPMLLLRDGRATEILENGLMLAAFTTAEYATAAHPLHPNDRLLLYTDGIPEAANAQAEEFGRHRLRHLLEQTARLPQTQAADHILSAIQQWSATQDDDLTLLVCDFSA